MSARSFERWYVIPFAFMPLSDQDWRPITFQGVTFPATLMGIDILGPVLAIADEELSLWLWRLPICRGVRKNAPAEMCARCAQRALVLVLERKQEVLDGIRERLASHGFDAETTYRDWVLALERIVELSADATGDCSWSAPLHPADSYRTRLIFRDLRPRWSAPSRDRVRTTRRSFAGLLADQE